MCFLQVLTADSLHLMTMYLDLEPTTHASAGSKPVHIGYFDSQETAARAYDQESLKLRGPNSNLNFPLSSYAVSCAKPHSTSSS